MSIAGPGGDPTDLESTHLKSKPHMYHRGGALEGDMAVVEQGLGDVNSRTVQMVKLLTEVGPDIPEISRRLGQFKESVRYRYKEKVVNRGFAVQAAIDHEKLGLKRIISIAEVPEPYIKYAQSILVAMHELCYVVSFEKALVGGEHIIHITAPTEKADEIKRFLRTLGERGLFSRLEVIDYDWFRNASMKADYYDFDTGRWDFDWQKESSEDYKSAAYVPSTGVKFDYTDLLIVKELQIDANKSLKEISDKLDINYKKLAWHHTTHVLTRGMIPSYTVNWMGTRYDYTLEKALHRKHRYFAVDFLVRDVTELELMTLRHSIDRLPFLWAEAGGKNYYASFGIPVDNVVEGLQYLGNVARSMKERTSVYPIDQTEAARFTIPYKLYDPSSREWTFDRNELEQKFESLLLQIKAGAS